MITTTSEEVEAATAILANSRKRLVCSEENLCEYIASGEMLRDEEKQKILEVTDEHDEDIVLGIYLCRQRFNSLRIQFSREIGEWIDENGGAA